MGNKSTVGKYYTVTSKEIWQKTLKKGYYQFGMTDALYLA